MPGMISSPEPAVASRIDCRNGRATLRGARVQALADCYGAMGPDLRGCSLVGDSVRHGGPCFRGRRRARQYGVVARRAVHVAGRRDLALRAAAVSRLERRRIEARLFGAARVQLVSALGRGDLPVLDSRGSPIVSGDRPRRAGHDSRGRHRGVAALSGQRRADGVLLRHCGQGAVGSHSEKGRRLAGPQRRLAGNRLRRRNHRSGHRLPPYLHARHGGRLGRSLRHRHCICVVGRAGDLGRQASGRDLSAGRGRRRLRCRIV